MKEMKDLNTLAAEVQGWQVYGNAWKTSNDEAILLSAYRPTADLKQAEDLIQAYCGKSIDYEFKFNSRFKNYQVFINGKMHGEGKKLPEAIVLAVLDFAGVELY